MPWWRRSKDSGSAGTTTPAEQQPQQQLELRLDQPSPPELAEASSSSSNNSDSSSSSSSNSTDVAAAAAAVDTAAEGAGATAAAAAAAQPDPADINPMLQTSLTRRFQGKFQPMQMPNYEMLMQEDMMNNCGVKSVIAGVMGGALGVAFGIFTASLDTQGIDAAPLGETKPTRVVLKETWILMKEKSKSYAKGFAGMGFLYSGTECLIEKYRAKHDKWNATLAGCATGGLMAAPGGPKAMCFGCASFAAFSTAIEYFTGGH